MNALSDAAEFSITLHGDFLNRLLNHFQMKTFECILLVNASFSSMASITPLDYSIEPIPIFHL
jgi:uncharacterized protein YpiB (UPF0302 family)